MGSPRLEAYQGIKPKLPRKRRLVYEAVFASPDGRTLREIAAFVAWPVHCVSGRVTELRDAGLLVDSGRRRDRQTVWMIGDPAAATAPKNPGRRELRGTVLNTEAKLFETTIVIKVPHDETKSRTPWAIPWGKEVTIRW